MKYIFSVLISIFFIDCSNSCKDVTGNFSEFSNSLRYSELTTYKFTGSTVQLISTSKVSSQDYKSDGSQEGNFIVSGDKVIMNFGGSDIVLNINRDSDGCIKSLSNNVGTYDKR